MVKAWQEGKYPFDELIKTYPVREMEKSASDIHNGTTIKGSICVGLSGIPWFVVAKEKTPKWNDTCRCGGVAWTSLGVAFHSANPSQEADEKCCLEVTARTQTSVVIVDSNIYALEQ